MFERHRGGKIRVVSSQRINTLELLRDLYTPGVARVCMAIEEDPDKAWTYTNLRNTVAIVTNGTAILGLGNIGPVAGLPVMEGKAALLEQLVGLSGVPILIDSSDVTTIVETVSRIAPGFGAIKLEDIRAPECFEIERQLIDRLAIPVMHDDQHGTAVITAAGLLNGAELQNKKLADIKIVCLGAGAAGVASLHLLVALGAKKSNIFLLDSKGLVHSERQDLNAYKKEFVQQNSQRTLADVMRDADVFIGVASADLVNADMLQSMAPRPVVFALANPDPEIRPEVAHTARKDLIMATGRTDFPNQINNVLGFPFIFRGALDVRARTISREMLIALVRALAALAHDPVPQEVLRAYGLDRLEFGNDYIIPKPVDPRLIKVIPPAVARAAIESGVARGPYPSHYRTA